MKAISFVKENKKLLIIVSLCLTGLATLLIAFCYYTISPYKKYIVSLHDADHTEVGMVLGAGINKEGKPYDELKARLDSAADAIDNGTVDKLILSGDNRFQHYDEPTAMKQYLIDKKQIPSEKLFTDYAGRSTYESCERAAKVFKVKKLLIFSAGSHLPRAIYLCRHFNIDAYGISSGLEANNSTRRELLARVKAVYNTQLIGEPTVLGDPIPLN